MSEPGPPAPDRGAAIAGSLDEVEARILGARPTLTRDEVARRAGVPLETATRLWQLLGFARAGEEEVAFTDADVDALRLARELTELGVLGPERESALVRTWGRSFARLAEWQTGLLAAVAQEGGTDAGALPDLVAEVTGRVDRLQSYVWRRHLVAAAGRVLAADDPTSATGSASVCFVDIVGYTARSRTLEEVELVSWLETFESRTTELVVDAGGQVVKNLGDEVLLVLDDPRTAVEVASTLARMGADEDDDFPAVRAGVAHGEVVHRLGDVFGPTVNVAARLTSAARPGTVLVDRGVRDHLLDGDAQEHSSDGSGAHSQRSDLSFRLRRVPRVHAKGYSRLAAWVVRER